MRKKSQTQELAEWFVAKHLKRDFDFRFDRQHLKSAKDLINPSKSENVNPLDFEVVQICIDLLAEGNFGFKSQVSSLHAVTWGAPPYYQRTLDLIAQVPPPYEVTHYDEWVLKYGRLAASRGLWSGLYAGYDNPLELPFRMPPEALQCVLGVSYA